MLSRFFWTNTISSSTKAQSPSGEAINPSPKINILPSIEKNTLELKRQAMFKVVEIYITLSEKSYDELNRGLGKLFSDLSHVKINPVSDSSLMQIHKILEDILEDLENGINPDNTFELPKVESYLKSYSPIKSPESIQGNALASNSYFYSQSELESLEIEDLLAPTRAKSMKYLELTKYLFLLGIDIHTFDTSPELQKWVAAAVRLESHIPKHVGLHDSSPTAASAAPDIPEGEISESSSAAASSSQPDQYDSGSEEDVIFIVSDPARYYELQEELRQMIANEEELISQNSDLDKECIIRLLKSDCGFTLLTTPLNNESANFYEQFNNFKEQNNAKAHFFFKDLANYLNEFRNQAVDNPFLCKLISFDYYVKDYLIKNSDVCLNDLCINNEKAGSLQSQNEIDQIFPNDHAQDEELPIPPLSSVQNNSAQGSLATSDFLPLPSFDADQDSRETLGLSPQHPIDSKP